MAEDDGQRYLRCLERVDEREITRQLAAVFPPVGLAASARSRE